MRVLIAMWLFVGIGAVQAADATSDSAAKASQANEVGRELIRDSHFRQGFILLEPKPGKQKPYGTIAGCEEGAVPVWRLAQWSSKFPLKAAAPERLGSGALRYSNEAKRITLGAPGTPEADAAFGVNALAEYGTHVRRAGEPWVHLLVEQNIERPPALTELHSVVFHLEARLLRSKQGDMPGYSPGLHAAQFQVFLTVQNLNRQSAGYGRYLWFGIPVYDDRNRIPREHKTRDTGGTDMFIFTPRGDTYASASAHDGQWLTIHRDILPLLREALETAWARGFLADSKNVSDYRLGSVNMGWEVPGVFDVEMQVRNLSLRTNTQP